MRCQACGWNVPYVIRATHCPACGADGQLEFDKEITKSKSVA
jgi:rubrerythrin